MLLSEVLNIANKLKHLNENFKSSFIQNTLLKLDYIYTHSSTRLNRNDYNICTDIYDIKSKYAIWYKRDPNNISTDIFNDPDVRDNFLNVKYLKDKNSSLIRTINDRLNEECGMQLDIANISDESIGVIDVEQAKKKGYKNQLQFWFDADKELRAIVCNNKIICMFETTYKDKQWPVSNKDYKPNLTQDECIEMCREWVNHDDDTLLNDFIQKAYTFRCNYDFYVSKASIRNYLDTNATSINKLIEFLGQYSIQIFSVDLDAMQENDITEKMKLRKDYKKWFNEQKNYRYYQRQRLQKKLDEIRANKAKNNTEQKILQFSQLCISVSQTICNEQSGLLTRNDPEENKLQQTYYVAVCFPSRFMSVIKQEILNQYVSIRHNRSRGRGSRQTVDYIYMSINNIFELLMCLSILIQAYISKINQIFNLYTEINETEPNDNSITDKIQNLSNNISWFKELHITIKQLYKKDIQSTIAKQPVLQNVMTEFEKIINYTF